MNERPFIRSLSPGGTMQPFPKLVPDCGLHAARPALPSELSLWLERAMGATPEAAEEARGAVLRALAQRFYPCVPVTTLVARIHVLAERYAFAQWPRDREHTQIPARYRGHPDEYLWAAFKTGAPMPLPRRELRRILMGALDGGV
jgi:hypothetical protein